ncbi:unnamed protein product [Soboliphyme baturini]|uniref:UDP-glucuronosyltransferase n=1 Tax=Soboliphyme baturini TaxID=241478 RepID=A0A183IWN8_9BILA|nr:unnamed protein product [Soboliphyme baturini]
MQTTFTSNVISVDWMPLTQMLGHPSVTLFVSHGGIRSLLEAVGHAVPILGIPMHGDQTYNLGRFREKGLAEVLPVAKLSEDQLVTTLSRMLSVANSRLAADKRNYSAPLPYLLNYRTAARKYKSMIKGYHSFLAGSLALKNKTETAFWVDWTVKHFLSQRKVSRSFIHGWQICRASAALPTEGAVEVTEDRAPILLGFWRQEQAAVFIAKSLTTDRRLRTETVEIVRRKQKRRATQRDERMEDTYVID